jgi:hypothetical protein
VRPQWEKQFLHVFIFEKNLLKSFSFKPAGQFQSNLIQIIHDCRELIFFSNIGSGSHQRGDNHKNAKIGRGSFKNLFLNNYARKALDLHDSFPI